MRRTASALALGGLLAAAGQGSPAHEPQTFRVAIRSMQYEPAALDVAVGDVVVWINEDAVPHTVTAAGAFDSQSLTTQQEWRYTATKPGRFAYGCGFHPTMKGTLTVH